LATASCRWPPQGGGATENRYTTTPAARARSRTEFLAMAAAIRLSAPNSGTRLAVRIWRNMTAAGY